MNKKKKKIKIPKSIMELKLSPKKFAKKHRIRLKGKGMSKRNRREAAKKLNRVYSEAAIRNVDKAVLILSENPPDNKKVVKVRTALEKMIVNTETMKRISKLYGKDPKEYPNMYYLPFMITNTILWYQQENLTEEEKAEGESLDKESLIRFCEKILKKQIRHYTKCGFDERTAFELAVVVPSTKLLTDKGRIWYKHLIRRLYLISESETVDIVSVLKAVSKVDGGKTKLKKQEFLFKFFSEFILTKSTNKALNYTDSQKELQENLIAATLEYLNGLKSKRLREILKAYIRVRKNAESYKNDGRRVIKFIDYANSTSKYTRIKAVVEELISDDSNYEIYLS